MHDVLKVQKERKEIVNTMRMLDTSSQHTDVKGPTPRVTRELEDVLNPQNTSFVLPDGTEYNSRLGDDSALQIQADNFQDTLNKTIEQRDKTEDPMEYIELDERVIGLREDRDRTLEQRQKEEIREVQEEDVTKLTPLAISIAGIITSILMLEYYKLVITSI